MKTVVAGFVFFKIAMFHIGKTVIVMLVARKLHTSPLCICLNTKIAICSAEGEIIGNVRY